VDAGIVFPAEELKDPGSCVGETFYPAADGKFLFLHD
jgi:hypothetical protein